VKPVAVVLAGGEGRRLRPLTERWPKPILPIDGRPVIAVLLRELAGAAIGRVTVVVGHLGDQVEALLGDGSAFGVAVRYARQPEPLGSADAVRRAVAAGARPPFVVSAADTVYTPGAVGRAAARWVAADAAGGLGVRHAPDAAQRTRVRVANDRLVAFDEDGGGLTAAPLWFLGEELAASLDALPGPPFELAEAFEQALAAGVEIRAVDVGPTRDLTRPEDVLRRNFPYLLA
jgi:MurNAc alpha-1-phosphate uridylyltransferase